MTSDILSLLLAFGPATDIPISMKLVQEACEFVQKETVAMTV